MFRLVNPDARRVGEIKAGRGSLERKDYRLARLTPVKRAQLLAPNGCQRGTSQRKTL